MKSQKHNASVELTLFEFGRDICSIPAKPSRHAVALGSAIMALIGFFALPARAESINFSDGFEGNAINSFWTVIQENGTASLSTAHAFSGSQSVALSTPQDFSVPERYVALTHEFAGVVTGSVSVEFYDAAPGQETLYQFLQVSSSTSPEEAMIGTQDYDANCYAAFVVDSADVSNGPNANCGVFPNVETTGVPRTLGWHLFGVTFDANGVALAIDGSTVYTFLGHDAFNEVTLYAQAPAFRPTGAASFDNFQIEGSASTVPEPSSIILFGSGLAGVAALMRRRALLKGKWRRQATKGTRS